MTFTGQATSKGEPIFVIGNREDSRITKISHDFSNKTTWWQNANKILGETLVNEAAYTLYNFAHPNIIDAQMISDRQDIYTKQLLDSTVMQKIGVRPYFHKIYKNEILQAPSTYTINHLLGKITFNIPNLPTDVIKADYYYAGSGSYIVTPPAGKKWRIYRTEVQFSKNIVLKPISFKIMAGEYILDERTYFTIQDYLNHSNLGFVIPASGGLANDVIVIPWDYETTITLKSSLGMKIQTEIENNEAMAAEIATCTFYMFEESETT